jgi:hypothetical protein
MAFMQVYLYQKYNEPLLIPDIMYYLLSLFTLHFSGWRHRVDAEVKLPNLPRLELRTPFSKVIKRIYFTVANTRYF